jgi:hypothetical protein
MININKTSKKNCLTKIFFFIIVIHFLLDHFFYQVYSQECSDSTQVTPLKIRQEWGFNPEDIQDIVDQFKTPSHLSSKEYQQLLFQDPLIPIIAPRRYRYLGMTKRRDPLPLKEWIEQGKRINKNRDFSRPYEEAVLAFLGLTNNNHNGEYIERTYQIVQKDGTVKSVTTRPDAVSTLAVIDHKHQDSRAKNRTISDSDQFRAQRFMLSDKILFPDQNATHVILFTSNAKGDFNNPENWPRPTQTLIQNDQVFYFDLENKKLYHWVKNQWVPYLDDIKKIIGGPR